MVDVGFREVGSAYWISALSSVAAQKATIWRLRMTGIWQPIWLQIPVRWSSNFRLLREFQSIFDLNAKIPDGAFQLGVS